MGFRPLLEGWSAGPVAVRAGHLHVLPWLLRHGCPLKRGATLKVAAQHCDLAGLQHVWELLGCGEEGPDASDWDFVGAGASAEGWRAPLLDIAEAVGLLGDGAYAKVSWLLLVVGPDAGPGVGHAATELDSSSSGLRCFGRSCVWQLPRAAMAAGAGCGPPLAPPDGRTPRTVLGAALEHGHVAVADWLVDQAGCPLPLSEYVGLQFANEQEGKTTYLSDDEGCPSIVWGYAACGGSLEAMRWLLGRGVPAHPWALAVAAEAGQLQAAQFLHDECGLPAACPPHSGCCKRRTVVQEAKTFGSHARSGGNPPTAAAEAGDVRMLQWLPYKALCPWQRTDKLILGVWGSCIGRERTPDSSDLEQAARLVVEAGCPLQDAVCLKAATGHGHLPTVRWLHEEMWVSLTHAGHWAAYRGCTALLEWLVAAGCQPRKGECYYDVPLRRGDVATLLCLRRLQVPLAVDWNRDLHRLPLPVMRWLLQQGVSVDESEVAAVLCAVPSTCECRQSAAWLEGYLAGQRGSSTARRRRAGRQSGSGTSGSWRRHSGRRRRHGRRWRRIGRRGGKSGGG